MLLLQFLFKAEVYFNEMKIPVECCLTEGATCLASFTSELDGILPNIDNIKVSKIEFCEDWIDTYGRVKYNLIELQTNEDMKIYVENISP